jgi:hypothetical protein
MIGPSVKYLPLDGRSGHLVDVLANEFAEKKVLPWELQQARDEVAYQAYATVNDPAFQVRCVRRRRSLGQCACRIRLRVLLRFCFGCAPSVLLPAASFPCGWANGRAEVKPC